MPSNPGEDCDFRELTAMLNSANVNADSRKRLGLHLGI